MLNKKSFFKKSHIFENVLLSLELKIEHISGLEGLLISWHFLILLKKWTNRNNCVFNFTYIPRYVCILSYKYCWICWYLIFRSFEAYRTLNFVDFLMHFVHIQFSKIFVYSILIQKDLSLWDHWFLRLWLFVRLDTSQGGRVYLWRFLRTLWDLCRRLLSERGGSPCSWTMARRSGSLCCIRSTFFNSASFSTTIMSALHSSATLEISSWPYSW